MRHSVGLVGFGYWGKIVQRYLEADEYFELAKIASPELIREGLYTNRLEDILEDSSVPTVFIASPIGTHFENVRAALLAGKNVVCEKPLSLDPEEINELTELASARNLILETNYIYTYSEGVKKVRELLPLVGTVLYCDLSMKQLGRFYEENVFAVIACHLIAVVDMFFSLENMEFSCFEVIKNSNGSCETGELIFKKNKLTGRIFASLNSAERERKINIYGSRGHITYNPLIPETVRFVEFERPGMDAQITASQVFSYNENDNLRLALRNLQAILTGTGTDNRRLSMAVTRVLALAT